jgi:hypothetical protein
MSELETRTNRYGFEVGSPELDSVGPIAFSPDGALFLADNVRAQIVALDLSGDERETDVAQLENLDGRLATFLGCARDDVAIRDLAVHPISQAMYLSVMRGAGHGAVPLVIRVAGDGTLSDIELENVAYTCATVDHAPSEGDERQESRVLWDDATEGEDLEVPSLGVTIRVQRHPLRASTVTDLAFVDGELLVAGASNEEFVSTLRRLPFPFHADAQASTLEIFHVSHGKYETSAPIRTFTPYDGGSSILASYTCTPLVHFPLADLTNGTRALGRTVAELGAMNSPVDIVSFTRDDREYVLVSNTRHPLVKIECRDIDAQEGLTEPQSPVGVPREELPHKGVGKMAVVDGQVLMLQRDDAGLHLRSYSSASL